MKIRLVASAAVAAAFALSMSGAEAATPTLDGKTRKVINVTTQATLQSNDKDQVGLDSVERVDCKPPRCSKTAFVYKPAKGVKGGLMLTSTWGDTATDVDLYLAMVNPNKSLSQIGTCGASLGNSEKVYAPASALRPGRTYVMVIDFYRTRAEVVKGKIEINVPDSTPKTVPDRAEAVPFVTVNCTL